MGKRKNKDKEEYIQKKIRKLEKKKLERISTEVDLESSPPTSPLQPHSPNPPASEIPPSFTAPNLPDPNEQDLNPYTEDDLPEELLQALGTEGDDTAEVGEAIRHELALKWNRIIQAGLGKESRAALIKKYPTPKNFSSAVAPIMNAEILATLSQSSLKRDKRICDRQNLIGKILTCLGKSLSKILIGNINSKVLVEEINDAAKFASEIYHQDSASRKFFALTAANKTVQEAVRMTTSDTFLFGADCGEKIRAAQAVQKTSSLIKEPVKKVQAGPLVKKQGNWKAPSQYQRARGGPQPQQGQRQPRSNQTRWKTQKPAVSRSRYHR